MGSPEQEQHRYIAGVFTDSIKLLETYAKTSALLQNHGIEPRSLLPFALSMSQGPCLFISLEGLSEAMASQVRKTVSNGGHKIKLPKEHLDILFQPLVQISAGNLR